ncbi:MAG: hypothetical protein WAU01_15555 [Saprospiraceae bacterium]
MKFRRYFFILLFCAVSVLAQAQKVTVSREIGIRNNYAYDIIPNIDGNIIFYHDRGSEHAFEIYDSDLRYKNTIEPEFEKKNIHPAGAIGMDTSFNYYYSYKEEGNIYYKAIAYDKNVSLIDSTTILVKDKKTVSNNPKFAFSKDKSKVLIFNPESGYLNLTLIDNHTLKLIYDLQLTVDGIDLKNDFEKLLVTDDGEIYIITRKSSFWDRGSKGFILTRVANNQTVLVHKFFPESNEITDLKMDFDEINKKLVLAGFTSEGDQSKINGYFGFSISPNQIPPDAEILINRFSTNFIADATGKKPGKVRELSDYRLQDIIIRNDGGVIMISELIKEFTRRSQMTGPGQFGNNFPVRGFVDYYHEDLIILATYPNGEEHWKKIFFKKQFSQDDSGIYSSYFLFKTPSRIRLIYNDEIKNNNTVSEYVMNPKGEAERKSVLSTEYQNLKLRFRNAIQVGSSSLIIPSEKTWKLNMVKIDYE